MPSLNSQITNFNTDKNYVKKQPGSNLTRLSVEMLANDFLQYCEVDKNLSHGTVKMYHIYLSEFVQWSQEYYDNKNVKYDQIDQDGVREFRLYLNRKKSDKSGAPIIRNTQNRYLTALRSFFRYLIIERNFDNVMAPDKISLGKPEPRAPKFLTTSQVDELVSVQDMNKKSGIRDRAILEMLFSTGMRISELTNLNRTDIPQETMESREFVVIGKGRKVRTVYLSDIAVKYLKRYLTTRVDRFKPLFVRYSGKLMESDDPTGESLRLTPRSVQRMIKKYSRIAGLSVDVTPHVLRHSFATDLLMAGADLRSVQELLGHSDVSTTQIYTHVTNKHLKTTHAKFHDQNDRK